VVCSFEVIEHFDKVDAFLSEVSRVLNPGGVFIVSTPNRERTPAGVNPFHEKEFDAREFQEVLSRHFQTVDCYGQFCTQPIREFLFMQSTRLYMQSRPYRNLINWMGKVYFTGSRADGDSNDPGWLDRMNPGSFVFRQTIVEQGVYLVGVCRK
jgi:SAM-dependent methyltransferase